MEEVCAELRNLRELVASKQELLDEVTRRKHRADMSAQGLTKQYIQAVQILEQLKREKDAKTQNLMMAVESLQIDLENIVKDVDRKSKIILGLEAERRMKGPYTNKKLEESNGDSQREELKLDYTSQPLQGNPFGQAFEQYHVLAIQRRNLIILSNLSNLLEKV